MTAPTPTTTPLGFGVQLIAIDTTDSGDNDVIDAFADYSISGNEDYDIDGLPYYIKGGETLYLLISLQGQSYCQGTVSFYGGYIEVDNQQ